MLVLDANILLYAFREEFPQHKTAKLWLQQALSSSTVAVPTLSEIAFVRLSTKCLGPLEAADWSNVKMFLDVLLGQGGAQRIYPGPTHFEVFSELVNSSGLKGDELVDCWLAALAIDLGATLVSADKGFARFPQLCWQNPLQDQIVGPARGRKKSKP